MFTDWAIVNEDICTTIVLVPKQTFNNAHSRCSNFDTETQESRLLRVEDAVEVADFFRDQAGIAEGKFRVDARYVSVN